VVGYCTGSQALRGFRKRILSDVINGSWGYVTAQVMAGQRGREQRKQHGWLQSWSEKGFVWKGFFWISKPTNQI
jgi:hypothetical protein